MSGQITGAINAELMNKWREMNPEYDYLKDSQVFRFVIAQGCGYTIDVAEIIATSTPKMPIDKIDTIAKGLANATANA